jgi:hypothetical protein
MKRSAKKDIQGHQRKKIKNSSLIEAVENLDYDAVKILLKRGFNPNHKDENGSSPLHLIAFMRMSLISKFHQSFISLRISKNLNHESLGKIGYTGKDEIDVYYNKIKYSLENEESANKQLQIAKLLLDNKADPNIQNEIMETPLHVACTCNNLKIVELLLKYNARLDLEAYYDRLPIHDINDCLIKKFSEKEPLNMRKIAKILLKHGADPAPDKFYNGGRVGFIRYDKHIGKGILATLPPALSTIFPTSKSEVHAKFQIKNICKTIGLFNCLSKYGFTYEPFLPQDVVCLIQILCSNVSPIIFDVVTKELKEMDAKIYSLKEKANKVFLSLKTKRENGEEVVIERVNY